MDLGSRTTKELETLERFEFLLQLVYFQQLKQPDEWKIQIASGLINAGNTALGLLIFGQLLTRIDFHLALLGFLILISCYIFVRIFLK